MTALLYFLFGHLELWTGFVLAHYWNSEHGAAIGHYILQKKNSLIWSFFCFSDFVCCNAVNLYTAAVISFYAT
jgi:hypothetical protein